MGVYMKNIIKKIIFIIFITTMLFSFNINVKAEDYSYLYEEYLKLSNEEKANVEVIPEEYRTSLKEYNSEPRLLSTRSINTIPSSYNLADHYNIKVKNQGEEGNCWAFASLETLETYLQIHGYGTFDFSENHLNYIESNLFPETSENRDINTAGSFNTFKEYASNKFGPVSEEDFPYYDGSNHKSYTKDELQSLLNVTPLAYVNEFTSFPGVNKLSETYTDEELTEFRNKVKKHIMENGALTTTIIAPTYYEYEYYNPETYAAYFNESKGEFFDHLHLVAIIGWDDNYSKDNFLGNNKPTHDGAYIALNSWGLNFGDEGLYYISYDDVYVEQYLNGITNAALDTKEFTNVETIKFNDNNLYNALKEVFGRKIVNYNDETNELTLFISDIENTNELNLSNKNISDISGLESFYGLQYLYLTNNKLKSLNGLPDSVFFIFIDDNEFEEIPSELYNKKIDRLFIGGNPISDFSGLSNIESITYLDIQNTLFTSSDLSYIKDKNIQMLDISYTKVNDLSIIKNNNIGLLNINGINDIKYDTLPSIEMSLGVSHTNFNEDKLNLIDTSNIKYLDISYTDFKDLSKLPNGLISLNISGNKNVTNLDSISNIQMITYKDADITDITPFVNFESSQLNLSNNKIVSYSDILSNTHINFIDLSSNEIDYFFDSDRMILSLNNNKFRPNLNYSSNIDTLYSQYYEETVDVDPNRDNSVIPISNYLGTLDIYGVNYTLENATYENDYLKILDYDKDIVINFINGKYDKSKVIYHLNKINESSLIDIYVKNKQDKKIYEVGESFDKRGLVIMGVFDNNSTAILNSYDIIDGDNLTYGTTKVTIKKNDLTTYTDVTVINPDDILNLSFNNKVLYNSVVSQIGKYENFRKQHPDMFVNTEILLSKNDSNQTLSILKDEFKSIDFLSILSDEITSLDGLEKLLYLDSLTLNGKNISDIEAINKLINNQKNNNTYLLSTLTINDNEKIKKLDNDSIFSLTIKNSVVNDINDMKNLTILNYEGNGILNFEKLLDTLKNITVNSTIDISSLEIDDNNNIILPNMIKTLYDNGLIVNAYLNDRIKSEEYIRSLIKKDLEVKEIDGKLVISSDSIKNYIDQGFYQYITINVVDNNSKYVNFKYNLNINYNKNNMFDHLEVDNYNPINLYENEVADLSNLTIYKVYMNGKKEVITNYKYDKLPVSISDKKIVITYTENNITKKLSITINVVKKEETSITENNNTVSYNNTKTNNIVSINKDEEIIENTDSKNNTKSKTIKQKEEKDTKINNDVTKKDLKKDNCNNSYCIWIILIIVIILGLLYIFFKKRKEKGSHF